jgi:hypothetical protein
MSVSGKKRQLKVVFVVVVKTFQFVYKGFGNRGLAEKLTTF